MNLIKWLYELLTGTPWTTVRSCTAEFGPTPGERFRNQLAAYSDAELYAYDRDVLLAEVRRLQDAARAVRAQRREKATR